MNKWIPCLLSVWVAAVASAGGKGFNYQPLDPGYEWFYERPSGATRHTIVKGQQIVRGRITTVLENTITGEYPGTVENFWSVDENGDVYLHGNFNRELSTALSFDPPILYLDVPLDLGIRWAGKMFLYEGLDSGVPVDEFEYVWEVTEQGERAVPAGTFYSCGISLVFPEKAVVVRDGYCLDLLGYRVPLGCAFRDYVEGPKRWYSNGIGLIEYMVFIDDPELLASWREPLSTRLSTWGSVKAMYRGASR